MDDLIERLRQNGLRAGLEAAGLTALGIGGWQTASQGQEVVVEGAVDSGQDTTTSQSQIFVDVAGAVNKPGVYSVEPGSRVAMVLEKAGGFSQNADGEWIAKMINQAELVKDGQKIFIPDRSADRGQRTADGEENQVAGANTINVNTASKSELDSLWGIGEARAEAIVTNRPFGSLEELKSKAGIPQDVLEKNEGKMSVY